MDVVPLALLKVTSYTSQPKGSEMGYPSIVSFINDKMIIQLCIYDINQFIKEIN